MKLIIAPDAFKGSLSAYQVCKVAERAILAVAPLARVDLCPMADGGEGTMEAVVTAWGGRRCDLTVTGPMGEPVLAAFALSADGATAVLDVASASGLPLVAAGARNPLLATSFGTGELLAAALNSGARRLIIGLGGSASNDGGAGLLQALGFRLIDDEGQDIPRGAIGLPKLQSIDATAAHPRLQEVSLVAACDVTSPLLGPEGASAVFGPQKGAVPEMVPVLESALARFAAVVERHCHGSFRQAAGAGAAGGLGFSLLSLLGATLQHGADLIAAITGLEAKLHANRYDWLLTGEGCVDHQSSRGKLLSRIGRLGLETGTPVIAFVGSISSEGPEVSLPGITHIFPIVPGPCSLQEAMTHAEQNLIAAVKRVMPLALKIRSGAGDL